MGRGFSATTPETWYGSHVEKFVVRYERRQGRRARKVAHGEGYDLLSKGNGEIRHIEVKSSKDPSCYSLLLLTENQFLAANRLRRSYWIYFVSGLTPTLQERKEIPITILNDPIGSVKKVKKKYDLEDFFERGRQECITLNAKQAILAVRTK